MSKTLHTDVRAIVKKIPVINSSFYKVLFEAAGITDGDLTFKATASPEDGKILDAILEKVTLDLFIAFGISACIGGYTNVDVAKRDSSLWKREISFRDAIYTMGDFLSVVEVKRIEQSSRGTSDKDVITMSKIVNICAPLAHMYLLKGEDRTSNMFRKNYHAFLVDHPDELSADKMRPYIFTGCKRVIEYSGSSSSICQTYLKFCKWMDDQREPKTNFALSERRYFHAAAANSATTGYKFDPATMMDPKARAILESKLVTGVEAKKSTK